MRDRHDAGTVDGHDDQHDSASGGTAVTENGHGPWGPAVDGGRRFRVLRRTVAVLGVTALLAVAAIGTTGAMLAQQFETSLQRVPVPELEEPLARTDARHFLLVGSDARDGLEDEELSTLSLGSFEGQRSDTIIYVSISEDREHVSLVSLPRDLLVRDGDSQRKLTDVYAGGADQLVRVIRENFGLSVNHYAQVSLGSFIEVVRTLGGVELCLDDPLVDPKAGADFEAGCQQMEAEDALSFVRSRSGPRADFDRIDRQQMFLRAVLRDLVDTRVLTNPRQLSQLIEDVAPNVVTDEALGATQMLGLADEMRSVVADGVPMATVPAYPRRIDGIEFMVPYGPGARSMFDDLQAGRPLAERGTTDEREETVVAVHGVDGTAVRSVVGPTLRFAGFLNWGPWSGPSELDAGERSVVYVVAGEEERAGWVAAVLGAEQRPLPEGVEAPDGATVVVSVGADASS
jgi:LCP family protein required for cell wall assembly